MRSKWLFIIALVVLISIACHFLLAKRNAEFNQKSQIVDRPLDDHGITTSYRPPERQRLHVDFKTALEGAEQTDKTMQIDVAIMYAYGENGAPLNRTEALKWFLIATKRQDSQYAADAARNAGDMYADNAHGIPPDYDEAYFWYTVARDIQPQEGMSPGYFWIIHQLDDTKTKALDRRAADWIESNRKDDSVVVDPSMARPNH
jgi:hypothetical protein